MKILNFLGVQNQNQINTNNSVVTQPSYGLKLKPQLSRDTVQFTSKKLLESQAGGISMAVAKSIHEEVKPAQKEVQEFVNNLFGDLVATKENPNKPIAEIKDRCKSPRSIQEKSKTLELDSKKEVLDTMTDLNGIKLELRDARKPAVNGILFRLKSAMEKGTIDLVEIENKRPASTKGKRGENATRYDYASREVMQDLIDTQKNINKHYRHKRQNKVNYNPDDYTEVNYCALHTLLKFPQSKRPFELTIMGSDVAQLKDLDDKLFKLLNNKQIDNKYAPLAKIIEPLKRPENKDKKALFNKYRGEAFLFQREREPNSYNFNKAGNEQTPYFLPMKYNLPPEYDLNRLYETMKKCDNNAAQSHK